MPPTLRSSVWSVINIIWMAIHSSFVLQMVSIQSRSERTQKTSSNQVVQIESVTCDGHKAALKAIRLAVPDVTLQRYLVHIQRMCLLSLTRYPNHISGIELRGIVLMLLKIKTPNDRLQWSRKLQAWYRKHKEYLNEKTYHPETGRYWYTHKMLRRAYFTIKRALPNMFHYISNPTIPKTTNGIEGFFSHLKNHLDMHRGLTIHHRVDFIKWYIFFSNQK